MSTATVRGPVSREAERLADMRRAFDQGFAAPIVTESRSVERMLTIRLGDEHFMMRANEITGLTKAKCIVRIPSRIPQLLGLAGVRGTLVPVFSLAAILERQPRGSAPVWLALAGRETPIALAFDEFEGQVELAREDLYTDETQNPSSQSQMLARVGSLVQQVVDIPSIIRMIRNSAGLSGPGKE